MKYHTTQKAARSSSDIVLSVGYCDLQNVLRYENPVAYNAGVNGWNFDLYLLSNEINLVTGYRGMSNASTHSASDIEGLSEALRALENDSYSYHGADFEAVMLDRLITTIKQFIKERKQ